MIELPVYNLAGKQVDSLNVDESTLGGEVKPVLLKQAYVRAHANRRQGSARTKSRGLIQGSTRKLFKQKGTGRARRGNVRTNLLKGGGVAFAKRRTRENFRQEMPRKMRRLANRNALLAKAVDQEIKVIDGLNFDKPKTSDFQKMLAAVGVNRTCLVALDRSNENAILSARNLEDVRTIRWDQLNVFDLLNHRFLVISKADLESFLANAHCTGSANGKGA